jgi:PEP-CTERM motif
MKKYTAACFALVVMFMEVSTVLASPLGQHINRKITSNFGDLVAFALSLKEAPEPGSLFMLGAVLLGLALFVFWKAAKKPKEF